VAFVKIEATFGPLVLACEKGPASKDTFTSKINFLLQGRVGDGYLSPQIISRAKNVASRIWQPPSLHIWENFFFFFFNGSKKMIDII
jgi:hypothetical protein